MARAWRHDGAAPLLSLTLLLLRCANAAATARQGPPCVGLGGAPVDWFLVLKHPGGYNYSYTDAGLCPPSAAAAATSGCAWRGGAALRLDAEPNPVAATLAALTTTTHQQPKQHQHQPLAFFMWNDADPATGEEFWDAAHAKGAAAFTAAGAGFYLHHSLPRWPAAPASGPWFARIQRAQSVFGQHVACFALGPAGGGAAARALARMLVAAAPRVHAAALPPGVAAALPEWAALLPGNASGTAAAGVAPAAATTAAGEAAAEAAVVIERGIATADGMPLIGFAKPAAVNASLLDEVVGPGLFGRRQQEGERQEEEQQQRARRRRRRQQRWRWAPREQGTVSGGAHTAARTAAADTAPAPCVMMWETWRRTADALPSLCAPPPPPPPPLAPPLPQQELPPPAALNIEAVRFEGGDGSGGAAAWPWRQDHSKWGVSAGDCGGGSGGGDNGGSGGGGPGGHAACLCDLNRAAHQALRGGTCICAPANGAGGGGLWKALSGIVAAGEGCRLIATAES